MTEVTFVVSGGAERSLEWVDRVTDELRADLEEIQGIQVDSVTCAAAGGTKTGVVEQVGQLAASGGALATAAWLVRDIVVKLIERTNARSITVRKGDDEIVITAASTGQIDRLIELLGDE